MAPPGGVVHATSPSRTTTGSGKNSGNGNNAEPQQLEQSDAKSQPQQQRHRTRGVSQQQLVQQQLRLPRTGSDRRLYGNNNSNRADVNANRKKIRRQGSLKTIQEENMSTLPTTAMVAEERPAQLQQSQTRQSLKGTTRGLQLRRSTTHQQQVQRLMQQQQQQQRQNETNSLSGIGIPQPPPPPPPLPLHIDSAQHTVSAFIPDDAVPLLLPSSASEENGHSGNDDSSRNPQQQLQHHSLVAPAPRPLSLSSSSSSSLYNDSLLLGYDNLVRVLNFHPKYLEIFLRCHLHLLTGDGPLPFTHRAYIGIMAVSRVRCSPLAQTLSRDFLNLGGDPGWLEGLHRVPNKIRKLSLVNKILAHRPWLVRKSHVAELTKNFEQEQWSASELVHALTLLTHFHALSTFVCACGLQRDDDAAAAAAAGSGNSTPPSSPGAAALANGGGGGGGGSPMESSNWMMDSVVERMQRRFNNQSREELTQEECVKRFFTVGSQTAELPGYRKPLVSSSTGNIGDASSSSSAKRLTTSSSTSSSRYTTTEETLMASTMETMTVSTSPVDDLLLQRFVEDPDFGYDSTLFDGKNSASSASSSSASSSTNGLPHLLQDEENEHLLCVQDYSWQEHGFSVLNRFYDAEGSNMLDDKFSVAENLTYRTMASHSGVDTFVFRRAIWNYIDVIFGIRHDDYDYKDIDELLPTTMRKFIKAAVCFPDKLVKKDYRDSMRELMHSEKVHINILMMEARFQGEMLYALRAFTQHLV